LICHPPIIATFCIRREADLPIYARELVKHLAQLA
jgi:hypothetical protein